MRKMMVLVKLASYNHSFIQARRGKLMTEPPKAEILDSYYEHRVDFAAPIFAVWTIPNPLVNSLYLSLRKWNVALKDLSWNKEPSSFEDLQLTFSIPSMGALIRVGLENATFIAVNPDWSKAPALVELFETAMADIQQTAKAERASQEIALAMHLKAGGRSLGDRMEKLVRADVLGSAEMYGISAYREDSSLVIDKSLRHDGGLFIRLYRKLSASVSFSEAATTLYQDEVKALSLVGLQDLIQG